MFVDRAARIVFLGPPGGGKGTHARRLSEKYGISHISTGDILRARAGDGTDLGTRVQSFIEKGKLVPDALMIEMISERMAQGDVQRGFILDGFPRTMEQAKALDQILAERGTPLTLVIDFEVSEDVIINRLSGRRVCPKCGANYHIRNIPPRRDGVCDRCPTALIQRADDREATVRTRLEVYRAETAPLVGYYRDRHLLQAVDGNLEVAPLEKHLWSHIEAV